MIVVNIHGFYYAHIGICGNLNDSCKTRYTYTYILAGKTPPDPEVVSERKMYLIINVVVVVVVVVFVVVFLVLLFLLILNIYYFLIHSYYVLFDNRLLEYIFHSDRMSQELFISRIR